MEMINIPLPDINENPKVMQQTILGTTSYTFSYSWMDNDYCALDIALNDTFLVRGFPMVTGSDLIGRVKNDELIKGSLFLVNKYGLPVEPTQENFNTDYYLVWAV